MPFVFSKLLDHGTSNPIVARLSLQMMQILDQCKIAKEARDEIAEIYMHSLQKKLIRCWEIRERFRSEFNSAVESYKPPSSGSQAIQLPQITRLEEECHNFLYEMKNYVRDLLKVFNLLYGTDFKEASEFYRAKKGSKSLVEFAASAFGRNDPKTKFLEEAIDQVEYVVSLRNAVEHPGGHSGELRITNFALEPDGKICEPTWFLEKDGTRVTDPSAIRADMETAIHNLLLLGEDVVASWAADNLSAGAMARVAVVPEERRDPSCPIKYVVTASRELEERLSKLVQGPDNEGQK
jgi:hypothetical protein